MMAMETKFICTESHPWRNGLPTPVVHPSGREIRSVGDIVTYRCNVCGHEWEMELNSIFQSVQITPLP